MIVTENPDKTQQLLQALRESFRETRGRDGDTRIHLSDLLYPRKTFFNRTTETLPTEQEALYWAAGRAHEDIVSRLAGSVCAHPPVLASVPGLVPGEYRERLGIAYRPDFRWDSLPCEMKTMRQSLPKPGEEAAAFEKYGEQLLGYCVLDQTWKGLFIIFDLLTPALAVYDVEFSLSECSSFWHESQNRLAWIRYSLKAKFHKQLPLCPAQFCGTQTKTMIVPPHCQDCQSDLTQKLVKAHQTSKRKFKGHIVTVPRYRWDYTPKCKFYLDCKPWEHDEARRQW